jgi:hypothetical protein
MYVELKKITHLRLGGDRIAGKIGLKIVICLERVIQNPRCISENFE